jgi:hypothetical protein
MFTRETRTELEAEFMRICRARGPRWIESVVRPLRLPNDDITVQDLPLHALRSIVRMFGRVKRPQSGVVAL